MIPCADFIPAYNELFKFLVRKGGPKAVEDFWFYLADRFLGNLKSLVERKGLRGCWEYWNKTLTEEAADFTMEMDDKLGEFSIEMHRCPSKDLLLKAKYIRPYPHYCRHCDAICRRVLEPMGYRVKIETSPQRQAQCRLRVTRAAAPLDATPEQPPARISIAHQTKQGQDKPRASPPKAKVAKGKSKSPTTKTSGASGAKRKSPARR